jgi:hypothetical protein
MNGRHLSIYGIALGIGTVGALAVGVPFSTLVFALLVLGCPLTMLFMHRGHAGALGSPANHAPAKDDQDRAGLR